MMNLITSYLEKYLGEEALRSRGTSKATGEKPGIYISLFNDQPARNAFTLASTGLSDKIFTQPDDTQVRHELLFCAYNTFRSDIIYERMFDVLTFLSANDECISSGQLFDCKQPIHPNSKMEIFFFYTPVYFNEKLHVIEAIQPHVVTAWIIPVHRKEMEFILKNGHEAFDELLGKHDPDLLDLSRSSIVQ